MYTPDEMGRDELTINPDGRGFVNISSYSVNLSAYCPHIVPLQFTGLKDKNGKDIYEGDIVSIGEICVRDMDDPIPFMRIIKWDDDIGGFNQFRVDGKESGSGWSFCKNALSNYYKIIGNIYENSELLETK